MIPSALVLALMLGVQGTELTSAGVTSAGGRWVARVRKAPGQERVDDRVARWMLSVGGATDGSELWSCPYNHPDVAGRALLSDDGSSFVLVSEAFSEARPVVRVFRHGRLFAELNGREFGLERAAVERTTTGASWLHEPDDDARLTWRESEDGYWLALELSSSRGWKRTADLSVGAVFAPYEGQPYLLPPVDPEFAEFAEPPYVTGFDVPEHALFGLPVPIRVVGSHPTPNWTLGGFELEWLGEEGTSFALLALSLPPPVHVVSAQVIEGFDGEAQLHGLRPGHYTITACGKEEESPPAQPLEVLPGRLRVRLAITGGLAGVRESVELYVPGVVRAVRSFQDGDGPRFTHAAPELLDRIDAVLPTLPANPRSERTRLAADFFEYHLEWWAGDRWTEARVDDGTARGAVRELIELMRAL